MVGYQPGYTMYLRFRETDGDVWRTDSEAFENWAAGNVTLYDVAATDEGGGLYLATWPSEMAAGRYVLTAHEQIGAVPGVLDPVIATRLWVWNGTAVEDVIDDSGQTDPNLETSQTFEAEIVTEEYYGPPA